jgi:hypothetical protein
MTSSVLPEESIRRTIPLGIKSTAFSPSSIPSGSSNLIDSPFFQVKSTTNNCHNSLDSSAVNDQDESKILYPNSECNVNNSFLFECILFDFILDAQFST